MVVRERNNYGVPCIDYSTQNTKYNLDTNINVTTSRQVAGDLHDA